MEKDSRIFQGGFSLRQAFTITNLVILIVGTTFTVFVLASIVQAKRTTLDAELEKEIAVAGGSLDATFDDARATVRSLVLGIPLILDRSQTTFAEWIRVQAELQLPRNPALFDLYFAFAEKPARRMFGTRGMAYAITRNLDYYGTPDFNAPSTFRVASYTDPIYQTSPSEIWWAGAVRTYGMYRTPFYYDTTYFKRVMVSITHALRDPKTGAVLGVAGVDLTAGRVAQILGAARFGETGGMLLTDLSGKPLAPFMGRDIPMLGFQRAPDSDSRADFAITPAGAPDLECRAGTHPLRGSDGNDYVYQARPLREPGYCIVAYQAKSEAYTPLYTALAILTVFAAGVLFVSLFFRQLLARFVIENINKILVNINRNREHFTESGAKTEYVRLEPEGPREVARIAHQLNLLYQRLQAAFAEVGAERDRAELATKTKSRFLSVMSHEIRTPLNAMLGLTDVLLLSPLDSEQVRHLRVLQRSGHSLLRILNDILDFSRLEAGKLNIESHEFGLYELLYDVESLMRFDAEAKGLGFRVVAPSHDYQVSGDSIRIRQALLNFVGNAIKFTAEGSIEIRVTAIQGDGADAQRFQFEVSDTGIGMSADQQSRLFSDFAQADASITRRYGGTGLGLAISRHIVELLGGKISVRSELGKGSIFQFTIPLRVLSHRKAVYRESPTELGAPGLSNYTRSLGIRTAKPDGRGRVPETRFEGFSNPTDAAPGTRSVLVVDDDEDNHRLIAAYMKFRPDLRAVHVFSGREALAKLAEEPFALVLLDMQMPEMDGLDATLEIRRLEVSERLAPRPIVMVSANTFPEDREKSLAAGANEHLAKPLKLEEFKELLSRWIPVP
ncbi:MAG: response regulator [Bdellovibrionales bacterium]|nr:response regulator [Bdellovibrionales bacterium]